MFLSLIVQGVVSINVLNYLDTGDLLIIQGFVYVQYTLLYVCVYHYRIIY